MDDPKFIISLQNLKHRIEQISNNSSLSGFTSYQSVMENIRQVLKENQCVNLLNVQDMNLKESDFLVSITPYLTALSYGIYMIDDKNIEYINFPSSSNNREALMATTALVHSPYFNLIFSSDKNCDPQKNSRNEDSKDKNISNDIKVKEYPLNVFMPKYNHIKCAKSLKILGNSIQKYILSCPYTWTCQFPENRNRMDGDTDNRYSNAKLLNSDFKKYKKTDPECQEEHEETQKTDSGTHDTQKNTEKYSVTLKEAIKISIKEGQPLKYKEEYNDALLTLGGPYFLEYFLHQNILYKNNNINCAKKTRHFFTGIYKEFNKNLYWENNIILYIFNCFALEKIINGSFLFHFCDFFSGYGSNSLQKN